MSEMENRSQRKRKAEGRKSIGNFEKRKKMRDFMTMKIALCF